MQCDIEYGRAGETRLLLDAHGPEGAGPFPIAILIHGGGWTGGDKAVDVTPLFAPLTAAVFTWLSINYRLTPQHRWPACRDDVVSFVTTKETRSVYSPAGPGSPLLSSAEFRIITAKSSFFMAPRRTH